MSSFYTHLKTDNDIELQNGISSLLHSQLPTIKSVTDNRPINNVYEIFKYELDEYGNMYILYKNYNAGKSWDDSTDVSTLTYADKLNAPGSLWVRLADSPIAFPVSKLLADSNT